MPAQASEVRVIAKGYQGSGPLIEVPMGPSGIDPSKDLDVRAVLLDGWVVGTKVHVSVALNGDGTWVLLGAEETRGSGNHYLHFSSDVASRPGPTPEQTATVAGWWLRKGGLKGPYDISPSGPVCSWAFAGMSPDEVSGVYGDGSKVYLNGTR